MPIPAGLALAGKLLSYGSTGLLVDDLTGKNLQRLLMGTPEGQRNYTVDAEGNYQPRKNVETKQEPQKERNFLERFMFGIPQGERNYTVNDAGEYQASTPSRPLMNLPRSVNTNLAAYDESVTLPNVSTAGNAGSVDPSLGRTVTQQDVKPQVVDTSTQLPASAEQTFIDPYAYQLQVYGQGRNAAQSQSEMDKVRDLGLAIHRDKYPQFYNNTSMSYQMRETFPDRSTQSLENSIKEKGVQLPGSMIDADSTNELLGAQEEQRIYQLDEATADVEALLAEIAARKQR